MKNSKVNRPISEKSYQKFVKQIKMVVRDHYLSLLMIKTLDRYLGGDRYNYYFGLDKEHRKIFEMLRFEVDAALERSARAKARARQRREAAAKAADADLLISTESVGEAKVVDAQSSALVKSDCMSKSIDTEQTVLYKSTRLAKSADSNDESTAWTEPDVVIVEPKNCDYKVSANRINLSSSKFTT